MHSSVYAGEGSKALYNLAAVWREVLSPES